jgi:hypothetical protein
LSGETGTAETDIVHDLLFDNVEECLAGGGSSEETWKQGF